MHKPVGLNPRRKEEHKEAEEEGKNEGRKGERERRMDG
jgi:hypothetical protein